MNAAGAPSSPSNLSTVTLVPSPNPSPEASTTDLNEDKGKKSDKGLEDPDKLVVNNRQIEVKGA